MNFIGGVTVSVRTSVVALVDAIKHPINAVIRAWNNLRVPHPQDDAPRGRPPFRRVDWWADVRRVRRSGSPTSPPSRPAAPCSRPASRSSTTVSSSSVWAARSGRRSAFTSTPTGLGADSPDIHGPSVEPLRGYAFATVPSTLPSRASNVRVAPGDPGRPQLGWRGCRPDWGGYTRCGCGPPSAAGTPFHMGPTPAAGAPRGSDRLDAGNVMSSGVAVGDPRHRSDRLWVDMSCDVIAVAIAGAVVHLGGDLLKADAATATITIVDPTGIYDPLNPPARSVDGGPVPPRPRRPRRSVVRSRERRRPARGRPTSVHRDGRLVAGGLGRRIRGTATTILSRRTPRNLRPLRPARDVAVGAGDSTGQRIDRIVEYFEWPGVVVHPPGGSTVTCRRRPSPSPRWELAEPYRRRRVGLRALHARRPAAMGEPLDVQHPSDAGRSRSAATIGHDISLDATPSALTS